MRGISKQDGFNVQSVVLVVLVVLAVGGAGWLVYQRNSTKTAGTKTNTNQAEQPTPQPKPSNEFVITEFNVKLTLPSGLTPSDLAYVIDNSVPGATSAQFTTHSLLAMDAGCTTVEGAIGIITQTADDPKLPSEQKVGRYYYAFHSAQGSCTGNVNAGNLEQSQTALLKQAFATIVNK